MTEVSFFRHQKVGSMRLFGEEALGVPASAKEEDNLWNLSDSAYKAGGEAHTNVIWVQNPWTQFVSIDHSEMPAATLGNAQHPNNEDCGIRDVWAHNLEDEFRTIRQVNNTYYISQNVSTFTMLCTHKVNNITLMLNMAHANPLRLFSKINSLGFFMNMAMI